MRNIDILKWGTLDLESKKGGDHISKIGERRIQPFQVILFFISLTDLFSLSQSSFAYENEWPLRKDPSFLIS